MVAYQCGIESRRLGVAGVSRIGRGRETHRFIAEGRQDFFVTQQPRAIRFKHQHRLAYPAANDTGRMLKRHRLNARNAWKPDFETCSGTRRALHLDRSVMRPDDFTSRREAQTIAFGAHGKKRLKYPLQRCSVHAASGIGNRDDHETAGTNLIIPDPQALLQFLQLGLYFDDPWLVHRLRGVVTDIDNDLLQLNWLGRHHYIARAA